MNFICIVLEVGAEPKSTCTLTLHWLQDERGATLQISLPVNHRGGQQHSALSRPYQLQQRFRTLHMLLCEGLHAYIPVKTCSRWRSMGSRGSVCICCNTCLSVHTAD
jgi:hypothetical protein